MNILAKHIMIWPVQSLTIEASIFDAKSLMETFWLGVLPILDGASVVGIITRRIVDGAIHHGLGAKKISFFMQPPIVIDPDSEILIIYKTISTLASNLLVVVDNNIVVGVVTKSSILRAVEDKNIFQTDININFGNLPPYAENFIKIAYESANATNTRLFLVGGIVRDIILNRQIEDIDIIVEGDYQSIKLFRESVSNKINAPYIEYNRFGTATFSLEEGVYLDVAMSRIEQYIEPAALPVVNPGSVWMDLRRRDFTINSIAIHIQSPISGVLIDPFRGKKDINSKKIKVLHPLSFVEDPTRIFRAIRFEQRFSFIIEKETKSYLNNAINMGIIERLSNERLGNEIEKLFSEKTATLSIKRLYELNLFHSMRLDNLIEQQYAILENLYEKYFLIKDLLENNNIVKKNTILKIWQIYVAVLSLNLQKEKRHHFFSRIAIRGKLAIKIDLICDGFFALTNFNVENKLLSEKKPSEIVRILDKYPPELLILLLSSPNSESEIKPIKLYIEKYKNTKLGITAKDLIVLGIPEGPLLKKCLNHVKDHILDNQNNNMDIISYIKNNIDNIINSK